MPNLSSLPNRSRRKVITYAGAAIIASPVIAALQRTGATSATSQARATPPQHLGLTQAKILRARVERQAEWLERHLDLSAFRTASMEALQYLADLEVPLCSANFSEADLQTLKGVFQLNTVNLRLGSAIDINLLGQNSPDAPGRDDLQAMVIELPHPHRLVAAAARTIAGYGLESIVLGEFNELDTTTALSLATHDGTLVFDVPQATSGSVANALSTHSGRAIHILSDSRPSDEVIQAFLRRQKKSFSLDSFCGQRGCVRWRLAWERTSEFVMRQHAARLQFFSTPSNSLQAFSS